MLGNAYLTRDTLKIVVFEAHETGNSYSYIGWICLGIIIILFAVWIIWKKWNIRPKEYEIDISAFKIKGDISYFSKDQEIAWKIYIELITRISSNDLEENSGILREALSSLHEAFKALRDILKNSSVELAKQPTKLDSLTVLSLTLIIMNLNLRPFLSKWHPLLLEWESKKANEDSQYHHESTWSYNTEFRNDLKKLREGLSEYIYSLKSIAEGKER